MRTPHALATTALLAATCLVLSGCDGGGGETSTDPTIDETTTEPADDPTSEDPSEEPTQSYRDQQIAAAEEFVLDFYATSAEVGHDGYENWEPRLFPFFTGDEELWQLHSAGYRQNAEEGLSLEGGTEVYAIEATDWEEAPEDAEGFDTVAFDLCLDSRSAVRIDADGEEITDQTPPDHRYPAEIEVMGQPDAELGWSLMQMEPDPEASC